MTSVPQARTFWVVLTHKELQPLLQRVTSKGTTANGLVPQTLPLDRLIYNHQLNLS